MSLSAICLLGAILTTAAPKTTVFYPSAVTRGAFPVVLTAEGDTGTEPKIWVDDTQLQLTPGPKPGQFQAVAKPACRPGWHVVRLFNKEGATTPIALWVDDLPNFSEAEPNNAAAEANQIPLHAKGSAARVIGRLEKNGDVDGFRVHVPAGATLVARMEANRTLGSPMDASLQVTDLKGFVLAHNDDARGVDPEIAWKASAAADVVVRAFAFPSEPNSTISFSGGATHIYQLTIATGPIVDHAANVAVGTNMLNLNLQGWNLAELLKQEIKPLQPGSNYAIATVEGAEPVLLPITTFGLLEPGNGKITRELKMPVMAGGTIFEKNQTDRYSLIAKKGDIFQLRVFAKLWDSIVDPVLILREEKGQVIVEQDDSGNNNRDIDLSWTAPADGRFQIEIADLHRRGGLRLYYGLEVSKDGLPAELNVDKTSLVLKAGEKQDSVLNYDKRADLDVPVKIQWLGLPKGFPEIKPSEPAQATATDPAKKGGGRRRRGNPAAGQNAITAPITLTADQAKSIGAWSGPVRMVATDAEGKIVPVRLGGDKGQRMGLDHIWVTVLPPEEPKKEKPAEAKKSS